MAEVNVTENSRADQWKHETQSKVFACSRTVEMYLKNKSSNLTFGFYSSVCQGGAVVSIYASHRYDRGSIPAWGICGMSYWSSSTWLHFTCAFTCFRSDLVELKFGPENAVRATCTQSLFIIHYLFFNHCWMKTIGSNGTNLQLKRAKLPSNYTYYSYVRRVSSLFSIVRCSSFSWCSAQIFTKSSKTCTEQLQCYFLILTIIVH